MCAPFRECFNKVYELAWVCLEANLELLSGQLVFLCTNSWIQEWA